MKGVERESRSLCSIWAEFGPAARYRISRAAKQSPITVHMQHDTRAEQDKKARSEPDLTVAAQSAPEFLMDTAFRLPSHPSLVNADEKATSSFGRL